MKSLKTPRHIRYEQSQFEQTITRCRECGTIIPEGDDCQVCTDVYGTLPVVHSIGWAETVRAYAETTDEHHGWNFEDDTRAGFEYFERRG